MQTIISRASGLIYLLLMFVATVISFWLTIDLSLAFHIQQPLFLTGFDELLGNLWTPGGLAHYLANFITTLYFFPLIGSIVVALLISVIPVWIFTTCRHKNSILVSVILSSIIWLLQLLLFTNYNFKLENLVELTGGILIAELLIRINKKLPSIYVTSVLQVVLLLLTYLLLGGPGLLISATVFIGRFIFQDTPVQHKITVIIISSIVAGVIPLLAASKLFILIPLKESYFGFFINGHHYINTKLIYVLVGTVFIIEVVSLFKIKHLAADKTWINSMVVGIFVTGLIVLPLVTLDKAKKTDILVDYYASMGKWKQVLQFAGNEQQKNYIVAFEVNRALHNTGGLMENVFNVKQVFGPGALFVESNINSQILTPTSDLYYDLGFINESRHWAHEAYTRLGKQPRILKRLVQVNIVLGKYNTAEKYILLLKKSLLYKKWAIEQEKFLYNEPAISKNHEYKSKRALMPVTDFFSNKAKPVTNVYNLMSQPAPNLMAFDYMMTDLMLQHNLIYIIKNVYLFKGFGYKTLPRPIQEAVILYMTKTQQPQIDLSGFKLSQETVTRFNEYTKLYALYKNNDAKSKELLDKKYANSFWYYIHFVSPMNNKSNKN